MTAQPLLFAAHGDRARRWADVVRRTRGLDLLAAIDLSAGGIEGFDLALRARPDAAVAVWSAGAIEATLIAERLVEHDGPSLLHPAPARPPLGTGVQVTHGWLSLSGTSAIERLLGGSTSRAEAVRLRVRGLPESPGTGLGPALYHAATLAHRFGRRVQVERAVLEDEQHLTLVLDVDGAPWRVEVSAKKGPELQMIVRTSAGDFTWSVDEVSERFERTGAEPRVVPAAPWAARCIRQIATPVRGADLADARAARSIVDAVEVALERRLPPTPFTALADRVPTSRTSSAPQRTGRFRISLPDLSGGTPVVRDAPHASDLLQLGLVGDVPDVPPLAPSAPPHLPALDALAYALDLRPAVLLTVDPQDEERMRELLPGAIERRDTRDTAGEPKVTLYAARDARSARKLADLDARDPTASAPSLGAMLGYPACCVQAYVAQIDHEASFTRYAIAARTSFGPGPWPCELDDTSLELLPHRPCTYRCERSREQVRALLAVLAVEEPALHAAIQAHLGGPVLYFDHEHQLRFRGVVSEGGIVYERVSAPWIGSPTFAQFAGAIARGDRLVLSEGALTVFAGETRVLSLERTDPGLGLILPFGRP